MQTEKQWNSIYWKEFNKICIACKNKCKQSYKVDLQCPNFIQIKKV